MRDPMVGTALLIRLEGIECNRNRASSFNVDDFAG